MLPGQLIDGEGRLVNCVWKTWAWETAFDQIREVSDREFAAVPIRTGHPQNEVRLIDVLLRPEVLVFEPLVDGDPRQQSDSADPLVAVPAPSLPTGYRFLRE